jgi:DNA-binding NarL/FixJ family response regulator
LHPRLGASTNVQTALFLPSLGRMSVRCLIVDDNPSFREEMRALLEEQGIDVVGNAASGNEALERIAELRPDVALVDINLRGESGLALTRRLGDGASGSDALKVILISTQDQSEYADLIEASSAVGFLDKTKLSAATIRRMLAVVDEPTQHGASQSDGCPGT